MSLVTSAAQLLHDIVHARLNYPSNSHHGLLTSLNFFQDYEKQG